MKYHRIDNPTSINPIEIEREIEQGNRVVVQFSQLSYTETLLGELNNLARSCKRNLEIRFYGHGSLGFDASVLKFIPNASSVSLDCLTKIRNLDALSALTNLKEFSLGVFELDEKDVLSNSTIQSVESLTLGGTRKANIDLSYLSGYKELRRFHTTGHTKYIDSITNLPRLASLSLSQVKNNVSLEFVSNMLHLNELRIILGGRTSISNVYGKELKKLEVIRVRGLEDLGDIGRFQNLETFLVEDQIKISQIKFGPNPSLKNIKILNCKSLTDIHGISSLKSLEQLRIYQTSVSYEQFISEEMPQSLRVLAFYTEKTKRDDEIRKDLASRGYKEFPLNSGQLWAAVNQG